MRFRTEVPRNIPAYFLFGVVAVAFAGFWTGGAYEQNERAKKDADVFTKGVSRTEGKVYTSYHAGNKRNRWNVTYTFATPTGQMYDGTFVSNTDVNPGTPVRVAYATHDPMVSHEVNHRSPKAVPPPIEWAGVAMGLLVTFFMARFAFDQVGAGRQIRWVFLAVAAVAFGGGLIGGLSTKQSRYTIQSGDIAWSAMTFYDTRRYIGIDLTLDDNGLVIEGKDYGKVPNHGHVWVRPDGVLVNGQKR